MQVLIRAEIPDDREAIQRVQRLAFGRADEGWLVEALCAGGNVRVSLVAEIGGAVIGHILFSKLPIITINSDTSQRLQSECRLSGLALAPLAVLPDYQRRGIGSQLVRRGLELCREQGHSIVIVLGPQDFYRRFGFDSELARGLASPFSGRESCMAMELVAGTLNGVVGVVQYPPPFTRSGADESTDQKPGFVTPLNLVRGRVTVATGDGWSVSTEGYREDFNCCYSEGEEKKLKLNAYFVGNVVTLSLCQWRWDGAIGETELIDRDKRVLIIKRLVASVHPMFGLFTTTDTEPLEVEAGLRTPSKKTEVAGFALSDIGSVAQVDDSHVRFTRGHTTLTLPIEFSQTSDSQERAEIRYADLQHWDPPHHEFRLQSSEQSLVIRKLTEFVRTQRHCPLLVRK